MMDNKFHNGNGEDGKHYWLTPPSFTRPSMMSSSLTSIHARSQSHLILTGSRVNGETQTMSTRRLDQSCTTAERKARPHGYVRPSLSSRRARRSSWSTPSISGYSCSLKPAQRFVISETSSGWPLKTTHKEKVLVATSPALY